MLPLQSKTTPTESGASSLENCEISCSVLSSKTLKFSFSSPVTKRFKGSVTVTGISTRVLSTRMLALAPSSSARLGARNGRYGGSAGIRGRWAAPRATARRTVIALNPNDLR